MGKKKSVTVGYRYFLDIHMGLCRGPINDCIEIRVGDRTAWSGSMLGGGSHAIDAYELFGGEKGEGGVRGTFHLHMGYNSQNSIPGLEAMVGAKRPAFRKRVTAFFSGMVTAINPYPKPWAFRLRRTTEGWDDNDRWFPEKATILLTRPLNPNEITSSPEIHAMNPAHIIMECLTNGDWGRGLPRTMLNISSFHAAAERLHSESFGLCLRWVRRDSLKTFLTSVLDHIAGTLFNDPTTGLLTLKLIRFDYNRSDVPLFEKDTGLVRIEEAPVGALGPMLNECTVTFRDPITNKDMTVGVQNLASMQASGGTFNSINRKLPGLPTPDLALRVAQRELRAQSVGLRKFKVVLDRRGWQCYPGGVIRVRDKSRGIDDMVLRIGRMDRGTLLNGEISIDAVNDVFSFPLKSYVDTVQPPPRPKPEPKPAVDTVFELPYFIINGNTRPADLAYIPTEAGYIGTLAVQPDPMHGGYDIAVRDGQFTEDDKAG